MICDTCKYLNTNHNEHPCYECLTACTASKYEARESEDTMPDFINREELKLQIAKQSRYFGFGFINKIMAIINEQPSADTERHAHWGIWDEDTNTYECSNCKNPFTLLEGTPEQNTYFYCPYCGCRMDEVINNE